MPHGSHAFKAAVRAIPEWQTEEGLYPGADVG